MLKFLCKLVNLTRIYKRKQKGMFFLNTVYIPNFIDIGKTFCGRTCRRTDVHTDIPTDGRTFPPLMSLGRVGRVNLKIRKLCLIRAIL